MNENIIAFVIIGIVGLVFVIGLIKWTIGVGEAIDMNESDSDIKNRRKEVENATKTAKKREKQSKTRPDI